MRIALVGGTGFVGSNTARALLADGHHVVLLARGSRSVAQREALTVVRADVADRAALAQGLAGCGAVVHLTAIIRERGRQTFDGVIRRGTENVVAAALQAGVNHLVYVSAIGAGADPRYPYLRAKWDAEEAVRSSGVPHTILRPSTIFGPGDGFFTTLRNLIRRAPVIPIAGDGDALFQPLAIGDLVQCIRISLERDPEGAVHELGGPEHLTYNRIVDIIRETIGARRRVIVHVPVGALLPAAAIFDKLLPHPPVTPVQLRMLERSNITRLDALPSSFGLSPLPFSDNAEYLSAG